MVTGGFGQFRSDLGDQSDKDTPGDPRGVEEGQEVIVP